MINLTELLHSYYINSYGPLTLPVRQFTLHSAVPNEQGVFFCKSGKRSGLDYVDEAVANGGICVIGTDPSLLGERERHPDVTFIIVSDLPPVITLLLRTVYNSVFDEMEFFGVTGTNGKTTVTYMISTLLNRFGFKTGSVGTEGVMTSDLQPMDYNKTTPTTPEAPELARIISHFHSESYQTMVYEATSIALDQERTTFIPVDTGVFTNFSRDHMDYHETIEHYLNSKMKLAEAARTLVFSLDSPVFRSLKDFGKPVRTFSLLDAAADFYGERITYDENGSRFVLHADGERFDVYTPFIGEHNIYNLLSAFAVLYDKGIPVRAIVEEAAKLPPLRNRFQLLTVCERRFILDFAHTPAALEKSLGAARTLADGKLIAMVNGIGLRGIDKVKKMAKTLTPDVDSVVLGAEQVGYVEPSVVIRAMQEALPPDISKDRVTTAMSRKEAIAACIGQSSPGDTILLTGINEPQHYKGTLIPHDDIEEISTHFSASCADPKPLV
ncbi:Mur ligase family protein [Salimicrobium album]|uniref:UDP-N-acetylmuramoylalanyl-D-glutamate--2,6-diaminopimelate ligase n=1 Tax=Salimicrobium album TaxID=50717 RepID=A0A1H3FD65_9BACI|nr:Mur ligase family protein [Salimicrobium album]SDX88069.1 UDP-N-acetylmuramoylalanyl-D-glutamate--2,6-diaminopimelate ligase [Salimicrobium album]